MRTLPSDARARLARRIVVAKRGREPAACVPRRTIEPRPPEARVRAAGGPQDRALYRCGCGYAFQADVSASVGCPHCGDAQAW